MKTYLLTGDIGGTNSRMSLYDTKNRMPLAVKFYRNTEVLTEKKDGLFESNVIAPFLQHCWETVQGLTPIELSEIIACLACAGPVRNNKVAMSNLHYLEIDGNAIEKNAFCDETYTRRIIRCKVINDFVAQGYGCLTLKREEVRELVPNSHDLVDCDGVKVCVGAGTGLGECFLATSPSDGYACFPSEGGHVEYNPRSDLEIKLRAYLMKKFGTEHRISTERVVSGRGLANVYEFLAQEFPKRVDKKVHEEFLGADDMQGRVVAVNATPGSLCKQALDIMLAAYGSEVGSSAIKFIPTGGLFVTGGLTPKNIEHIDAADSEFMKAYKDKGRVTNLLETVPLFAVMVEDLGIRGAHKAALLIHDKLEKDKQELSNPSVKGGSTAFKTAISSVEVSEDEKTDAKSFYGPGFLVFVTLVAVSVGVFLGRVK